MNRQPESQNWDLPRHAARERRVLEDAGIRDWKSLAELNDEQLNRLAHKGGASSMTLLRLRGQARLVVEIGLTPAQAALLLHAGVPDGSSLAVADPHQLWVQTGRLQRRLTNTAIQPPNQATLRQWITRARRARN